ncbi:MAG: adenine phosphoribosyltransferase [Cyclobacteriaceae bacterium]|nr:adenine phosphoribosyltransferase [Cyclobacteriaceae bacterium]
MQLEEKIKRNIRDIQDYPKPGIIFRDITPVLANPNLVSEIVQKLVDTYKAQKIDAIVGVEARGFIFGSILAHQLNCRFIPVRKSGKLPFKTHQQEYALEYGTASVEMHTDAIEKDWRVLIHDDLLATGGTAGAAARLVQRSGGEVTAFSFLINLSFLPGEKNLLEQFGLKSGYLVKY